MNQAEGWYVMKQPDGHCEIVGIPAMAAPATDTPTPPATEQWGPFASQGEAIARRVGLIRAGKCQPI